MAIKKQSKIPKKKIKNQDFQIPRKWEFFIVKKNWIEGKVLKVTSSWEITVLIGGEEKVILNLNLWKQIDQGKWYFKKPKTKKEKNIEISEIEKVLDNPIKLEPEYENTYEWENCEPKMVIKKVTSEQIWETLTKRQQKFCELYATEKEFFWNWVQAYLEVYDVDTSKPWWYKTACAGASRMLSNVKVMQRINELLDSWWFNNQNVDKQHAFLINQFADLWVKMRAISEFNSLKQRITQKLELSWWIKTEMTEEQQKMYNRILQQNWMIWKKETKN